MRAYCRIIALVVGMTMGMVAGLTGSSACGEDRVWQVSGAFIGLKPGTSAVAVIELPDKSRIEVPLAALAEADRQVVRGRADTARPPVVAPGTVTVRGPTGRVTVPVPEALKGVETDAIWCRSAADAMKVYWLYLGAASGLSVADKEAAAARLAEWSKRAGEKRLRMGDAWLLPEQRAQGRRMAIDQVTHATEVIRLGNWPLAEDELKKAVRLDPDLASPDILLGLGYFLLRPKLPAEAAGNVAKAIDFFSEAVRREPDDVIALNNLGLAEMYGGKYAGGVTHLVRAAYLAADDQVIADNLGLLIREAAGLRPKMPDKLVGDLNDRYREQLRNPRLKPLAAGAVLMLKSPSCQPIPAVKGSLTVAEFARQIAEPAEWVAETQTGAAAVVGDGLLLTTIPLVPESSEILVEDPTSPGRQMAAREVATSGDNGFFLLRCDGLIAKPLPVAAKGPAAGEEVSIWGEPADGGGRGSARPVRGRVSDVASTAGSPPGNGGGGPTPFLHRGAVTRGPGGAPIVDRQGRLLGLEAPLPRTDAIGDTHGLGLPIDAAWPMLREHLPDLAATASAADSPPDWSAADAGAAAGTVVVTCRRKVSGQPPK